MTGVEPENAIHANRIRHFHVNTSIPNAPYIPKTENDLSD